MSTRSVVAVPDGEKWKGRYVHSDGYPSHLLTTLHQLVNRDGVETVIKVITEDRYGWSSLNADELPLMDVAPDGDAPYGSAAQKAAMYAPGGMYADGRFASVSGYGTAYTTVDNQSSPDEWVLSDGEDWGTEWAYVLHPEHVTVMRRLHSDESPAVGFFGMPAADGGHWGIYAYVRYDAELTDALLEIVECGIDYSHCGHYAWAHFPEAEGTNLDTDEWLGRKPVEPRLGNARAAVVRGVETDIGFGGGQVYADGTRPDWNNREDKRPRYWESDTRDAEGLPTGKVRMGRIVKDGIKLEHDLIMPATSVAPEFIVPAGTVVRT